MNISGFDQGYQKTNFGFNIEKFKNKITKNSHRGRWQRKVCFRKIQTALTALRKTTLKIKSIEETNLRGE